jgi:DNA uptake protein ComE-like DNA-binding protein
MLMLALASFPGGPMTAGAAGAPTQNQQPVGKSKQVPPPEARVDINHASEAELLKVPGLTASWAGRIVRFRPYRTKQDLLDRGVLPSDVYDRSKDYVIAHREKQ